MSDYDLAKQIRIAERNKLLVTRLGEERTLREKRFPLWAVGLGVAFVLSGLALAVNMTRLFHAIHL